MAVLLENNAVGTLSVEMNLGTYDLVLQTGEGALFPSIVSGTGDHFYVRVGTDENNEVMKVVYTDTDTLSVYGEPLNSWPVNTDVKLTVCKELFSEFQQISDVSSGTINVGSGQTYTTIADFLTEFTDRSINYGVPVVVSIHPGIYEEAINDAGIIGSQNITIQGWKTSTTYTSIQSSSGSSGAWSIVVNVTSVTGIVAGYICRINTASGGTNPDYLIGSFEITNVDSGNSRITLSSNHTGATAPSGSVAGDLTFFKTVLLDNGISLSDKGYAAIHDIGINNGSIDVSVPVATYIYDVSSVNAGDDALSIYYNGRLYFDGDISNCSSGCYLADNALLISANIRFTGCSYGMYILSGMFKGNTVLFSGGDTGLFISDHGTATIAASVTAKDNTSEAIHAERYGYVKFASSTMSGNGTNYNPAINTQGNKFGYIDDGT